jgi:hydrophobe/amphiphile efflux-1 (HAE1) family protein
VNITDVSVRNPVFAWMLMASTVLFGLLSLRRIGVSQYPDVDYPNITVSASWSGASPSAVERELVEPLEQAIAQVEGVRQITSSARQGSARITCVFDMSRNVDLALQDVQAKTAQAQRQLPKDVPAISVSKANPDDTAIVQVAVYGAFSRQVLADVARYQVQDKLQTVEGVGQITLSGYVDRNVRIWLDANRLMERGVVANDVLNAIKREHVEVPGGQLEAAGRQVSIRLLGEALDLATFKHLVVAKSKGQPIYLEDVALVEDGFADINSVARLDGVPMQAMGILKQRGTNAVAVAQGVRAKVDEIKKTLPEGMEVEVLFDSTTFIEESVHEIEIELGLALVLTSFVCWLFLGSLSSTVNVILAIPMSLLGTVAVIYFLGFTLNTFTLMGLSLSIGLVVDDAVMVMENIYRHAEMGKDRVKASLEGTKEITFAALAATLAVIAIFLPVIFMDGVVGRFFFQFGVTLSIAVMISYFEAISLAPARCAQILDTSREGRSRIGLAVDRGFTKLERFYHRVLEWALDHPLRVLAVTAAVTAASVFAYLQLPTEFIPSQDQSRLNVRIQTTAGASLDSATPLLEEAERRIAKRPEVARVLTTLSGGSGSMTLTLVPVAERKLSAVEVGAEIRKSLSSIAGIRASVQDPSQQSFGGSQGSPIQFTVRGSDWDALVKVSNDVKDRLENEGVGVDLTSDYQLGSPEVQIEPDRRRASELGVSISDLGNTVSALIGGNIVGKFATEGRRIDIRARLLAAQRARPEDIGQIRIRSSSGDLVPLSLLVTQEEKPVLQAITRVDRERAITIRGNVATGMSQGEAIKRIEAISTELPLGTHLVLGGQSTQLSDTAGGLVFALMVGILVAYMVLASQFNSFLHPATVLTILPLALSGAAFGLLIAGKSLNVFSMIGVLLLMGIVKKNSILLVEYSTELEHHEGVDAREGMLRAGPLRLRPILMTTIATMMSAVPALLGLGAGAETRGPMSAAVLGGLTLSTVLSLLVVPVIHVQAARLKARFSKKGGDAPPTGESGGPGEPGSGDDESATSSVSLGAGAGEDATLDEPVPSATRGSVAPEPVPGT